MERAGTSGPIDAASQNPSPASPAPGRASWKYCSAGPLTKPIPAGFTSSAVASSAPATESPGIGMPTGAPSARACRFAFCAAAERGARTSAATK
jgi:hypothetical protein